MKRRLSWFLLSALAAPSFAAFQTDFSGARSAAMGGAVTADASGAASYFDTPAALAGTDSSEASMMYANPFADAGGGFGSGAAALALPTRWGTLGAGVAAFEAADSLKETTFSAGYGVSFLGGRIRAGASLKRMDLQYSVGNDPLAQNDPVFRNGDSRSAFDVDAGLSLSLGGPLQGGVTVRNLRRADLGLAGRDRLRREVRAGLSLDLSSWGMKASGDLLSRTDADGSSGSVHPGIGLEKSFKAAPLFLRAGANRDRLSAGLGFTRGRLSLDYAFIMPRAAGADASAHQAQLTYRFNREER